MPIEVKNIDGEPAPNEEIKIASTLLREFAEGINQDPTPKPRRHRKPLPEPKPPSNP